MIDHSDRTASNLAKDHQAYDRCLRLADITPIEDSGGTYCQSCCNVF